MDGGFRGVHLDVSAIANRSFCFLQLDNPKSCHEIFVDPDLTSVCESLKALWELGGAGLLVDELGGEYNHDVSSLSRIKLIETVAIADQIEAS